MFGELLLTVTVTKMPGGVVQVLNPDSGKVTYKAKSDTAYLNLESFGGIVKFNKKGSKITMQNAEVTNEDCEIIKKDSHTYKTAMSEALKAQKIFLEQKKDQIEQEISQVASRLGQS